MKTLIIFDLDGTLAESKSAIDTEMAALLNALLAIVKVAIISGGGWQQFESQLLPYLTRVEPLDSLSLLPTCGTRFYRHEHGWRLLYSEDFSPAQKAKIISSLQQATDQLQAGPTKLWGDAIEDRGSQITFSALGQLAPLAEKKKWDPDFSKRKQIKMLLDELIPEFSTRLGGATSIDVTMKGIDKAYGIHKLRDFLGIPLEQMMFIGDALFPGGNDYPAMQAGVVTIGIRDPQETKRVIETLLACLQTGATQGSSRSYSLLTTA